MLIVATYNKRAEPECFPVNVCKAIEEKKRETLALEQQKREAEALGTQSLQISLPLNVNFKHVDSCLLQRQAC